MLGRVPDRAGRAPSTASGTCTPARSRTVRIDAVSRDVGQLRAPALHLQIGDATDGGTEEQDEGAAVPRSACPRPWVDGARQPRHPAQRAHPRARGRASYGQPVAELLVDLDFVRVVLIGPNRSEPGQAGRGASRPPRWRSSSASSPSAGHDCWIACHWPLFRTVMGDPRLHFTSAMAAFHAKPDERIRDLLRGHRERQAVALGAHALAAECAGADQARAARPEDASILAINTSALVGVGKRRNPARPAVLARLTHRPGRIEIRARDHRAGEWRNVRGRRVVEMSDQSPDWRDVGGRTSTDPPHLRPLVA